MILLSYYSDNSISYAIKIDNQLYTITTLNSVLNKKYPTDIESLLKSGSFYELKEWFDEIGKAKIVESVPPFNPDQINYAPLYLHPGKIWGIGLNYKEHAADLDEVTPEDEPASFMKPYTAIIGHGDEIEIPLQSEKTTAEAELGIIIGKCCKEVECENWLDMVAGFTTIIDMTAEDILRKNPRFLTRSKSFDTFFSFGPALVTPDEIENLIDLKVSTIINDKVHASNIIRNMTFPPDYLVSFHSKVMTMLPGDIISSGTPGAVHINHGDKVECRIEGFETLINTVIDLKKI